MSLAQVRAMSPREWDLWRVYWSVRPREDPYVIAAMIRDEIRRDMIGERLKPEEVYPKVVRRRRRRRHDRPEHVVAAIERTFGKG